MWREAWIVLYLKAFCGARPEARYNGRKEVILLWQQGDRSRDEAVYHFYKTDRVQWWFQFIIDPEGAGVKRAHETLLHIYNHTYSQVTMRIHLLNLLMCHWFLLRIFFHLFMFLCLSFFVSFLNNAIFAICFHCW